MYPPEMEPALGFLRLTRCAHEAHARVAVGFDTDGISRGASTATYPPELNRIMTRALAYPNRCASDEAWTVMPELVCEIDEVKDTAIERGIVGDRQGNGTGAALARGHSVNCQHAATQQSASA